MLEPQHAKPLVILLAGLFSFFYWRWRREKREEHDQDYPGESDPLASDVWHKDLSQTRAWRVIRIIWAIAIVALIAMTALGY